MDSRFRGNDKTEEGELPDGWHRFPTDNRSS